MVRSNMLRISTALIAGAVLVAFALVWIGRATADRGAPAGPAAGSKTVSNVATGKADAVDAIDVICTVSPQFNPMPDMTKTFSFGGTRPRSVMVLFQVRSSTTPEDTGLSIEVTIDGVITSGPRDVLLFFRGLGDEADAGTHGFNFISDPLVPGEHTARILWRDTGGGSVCVSARSMIILHK